MDGVVGAAVGLEVIYRHFDRLTIFENGELLDQQIGIQRVGMVEIDFGPLGNR